SISANGGRRKWLWRLAKVGEREAFLAKVPGRPAFDCQMLRCMGMPILETAVGQTRAANLPLPPNRTDGIRRGPITLLQAIKSEVAFRWDDVGDLVHLEIFWRLFDLHGGDALSLRARAAKCMLDGAIATGKWINRGRRRSREFHLRKTGPVDRELKPSPTRLRVHTYPRSHGWQMTVACHRQRYA